MEPESERLLAGITPESATSSIQEVLTNHVIDLLPPENPGTLATYQGLEVARASEEDDSPDAVEGDSEWLPRQALYSSHFLSTWGQRMWEFAIGLIILELRPGSLALIAAFGLIDSTAQVIAGPIVGGYVDRTPRLKAACAMYVLQNVAVALSAAATLGASVLKGTSEPGFWACVVAAIGLGSLSSVGCQGSALSVEREWTKALCHGKSAALATLNAGMRRVDLTCLIASPIMAGIMLTHGGLEAAVIGIVCWNLAAWLPECLLLSYAQRRSSVLRRQDIHDTVLTQLASAPATAAERMALRLKRIIARWRLYRQQDIALAAMALALLYLTVMSFGLMMTAYLKWRGLSETVISLYRGGGAASGIASTLLFPRIRQKLGQERVGALGIYAMLVCLVASVVPLALPAAAPAALPHMLAAGLVASRFGLWTFDLTVGQMLQERVPNQDMGAINGVQSSLQNLMQALSYAAGLVLWRPEQFVWLMLGSVGVVTGAAALYTCFVFTAVTVVGVGSTRG